MNRRPESRVPLHCATQRTFCLRRPVAPAEDAAEMEVLVSERVPEIHAVGREAKCLLYGRELLPHRGIARVGGADVRDEQGAVARAQAFAPSPGDGATAVARVAGGYPAVGKREP